MRTERDLKNQIAYAKEEGIKLGREEGRKEGRKEGREKGRKEGREEERRQLAVNMLLKGFDPAVIAEITSLSEEEVSALAER